MVDEFTRISTRRSDTIIRAGPIWLNCFYFRPQLFVIEWLTIKQSRASTVARSSSTILTVKVEPSIFELLELFILRKKRTLIVAVGEENQDGFGVVVELSFNS